MLDALLDGIMYFRLGNSAVQSAEVLYGAIRSQPTLRNVNSLPAQQPDVVRIVLISDTHDRHYCIGNIPKGDVFVHAGDICMTSRVYSEAAAKIKLSLFNDWLTTIPCKHKIVIGGNHDCHLERIAKNNKTELTQLLSNATYLQNETICLEDIVFYGSPVSRGRSHNSAFQSDECHAIARDNLQGQHDIDVLVTHGSGGELRKMCQPRMHIYGHVHGAYGIRYDKDITDCAIVNGCMMDGRYNPSNPPIVFDITKREKRE